MKKNIVAVILSTTLLFSTVTVNAFAIDINKNYSKIESKLNKIDDIIIENEKYLDKDFVEVVKSIVEIKKLNPNLDVNQIQRLIESKSMKFSHRINYSIGESVSGAWNKLTDAEKKLVILYPAEAIFVNSAKNKTDEITIKKYPNWQDGDKGNAFRHALWNAMMARDIGHNLAEKFATAHENFGDMNDEVDRSVWGGHTGAEHRAMDMNNNAKGRACVKWYEVFAKNETLANRVQEKIDNGEMIILVK